MKMHAILSNPEFRDTYRLASTNEDKIRILKKHGIDGDLKEIITKIEKLFRLEHYATPLRAHTCGLGGGTCGACGGYSSD